jgi:hypothetical protein
MQFELPKAQIPDNLPVTATCSVDDDLDNSTCPEADEPELIVLATDNSRTVLLRSNLLSEGHQIRPFCPPLNPTIHRTHAIECSR